MRALPFAALVLSCCLPPASGLGTARAQRRSQQPAATHAPDPEAALEKAFSASGSDRAALVRNLQQYLSEFPDAPRKADVYRALVDACQHLRNDSCALDYAERLIALQPDDSDMMLLAVTYLQRKGDDESLTRAADYVTRVIDLVEKSPPDRPAGESAVQWEERKQSLRGVLYYLRGQIRYSLEKYDLAAEDLTTSYEIHPNASAADMLGEIAELKGDPRDAIEEYTLAFVLPDRGPDANVNRRAIRERLGNTWRVVHGSNQGLGDKILRAYDSASSIPDADSGTVTTSSDAPNENAKDVLAFTLRRADGPPIALATLKGKVIVVNFWATWCVPCAQINAEFNDLAMAWSGDPHAMFLMADTNDQGTDVASFAQKKRWRVPVVYADGLDRFLKIETLPAAIVIGPDGRVIYRVDHPVARGFGAPISSTIQQALSAMH